MNIFNIYYLKGISELQKIDNVFFSNVIKMQKFCISRFFAYYRRMADVRWKLFKYWGKNKCFCIISTIFFLKIIKFSRKAVFSIPKYFLSAYSVYNTHPAAWARPDLILIYHKSQASNLCNHIVQSLNKISNCLSSSS